MNVAPLIALLTPSNAVRSTRIKHFTERLASGLNLHLLHDGLAMQIFGLASSTHLILPGSGLVWGHVFDRHSNWQVKNFVDLRGAGDPAAAFVERNWGNYLAFRTLDGIPEVLRDASGGVPCYHAVVDGTQIFTTCPDLLFDTGLLVAEIDWTILAQAIAYRDLKPARTAIRGLSELLPGMAARVIDDRLELAVAWSPWSFVERSREISDFPRAVELVRRSGTNCLNAWRGQFARPLIEISGGLDSSIVATLMSDAAHKPFCVTFAAVEGDPDETPYARTMANHLGLELVVLRPDVALVDLTLSTARNTPRPCARGFTQGMDRQLSALALEIGADSFFSGGGGDNVFCYLQSALPLIDRIYRTGLNRGVLATAGDLAELAQVSVWEVVLKAMRSRSARTSGLHWRPSDLLRVEVIRDLPKPFGHPWVDAPSYAPPGKRAHVRALMGVQNHLEGHDRLRLAPILSPLLSQPLVETCLQIPSWLWCRDGQNRAVARDAFSDRLPVQIVERRSKGAFDGFCAQLVHRNRSLLHELLIDGELVRQALVDPKCIASWLRDPDGEAVSKLLALADMEAWIASWKGRRAGSP